MVGRNTAYQILKNQAGVLALHGLALHGNVVG